MKNVFICIMVFITGCNAGNKESKLTGTYTGKSEHEFAKNEDTLFIKKASDGKGIYEIIHHTGMRKKVEGELTPKELITEEMLAEYNNDTQILTSVNEGVKFIWNKENLSIKVGDRSYTKITQ